MKTELQKLYEQTEVQKDPPRVVLHEDGTRSENKYARPPGIPMTDAVDGLFGQCKGYVVLKKEKPEHRLMLWLRLQGHTAREIAATMGVTPQTVSNVWKQPWFQDAFVRLSAELGKDAAETFLRGEEIPTLMKLVDLRDNAESEQVQASVAFHILDRIRGKPVAHVKSESQSSVDVTVQTVDDLLRERAANEQRLRANGILPGSN